MIGGLVPARGVEGEGFLELKGEKMNIDGAGGGK